MRSAAQVTIAILVLGCRPAGEGPSPVGGPCSVDGDCESGLVCMPAFPGGYCSLDCRGASCPEGSACMELGSGQRCMQICAATDECRQEEGYVCNHGVCDLACSVDEECRAFERCGDGGVCEPRTDIPVGEPCPDSEACASDLCLDGGRGPVCTAACASQEACETYGLWCRVILDADAAGPMTACLDALGEAGQGEACQTHADCESGICAEEACTVRCDGACPAPAECVERALVFDGEPLALRVCLGPVEDGIEILDFPDHVLDAPMGGRFEAEAGRGAMAFMIYVEGEADTYYAVSDLTAPDGTVLVDHDLGGMNMIMPSRGIFTALVPDTDRPEAAIQEGTYTFFVIAIDETGLVIDSRASVKILVKTRQEEHRSDGRLDLHIFLAQGAKTGVDASNAESDPEIARSLEKFRSLFTDVAGIEQGEVHYYDAPAAFSVLDSEEEMAQLLMLSSGASGDGLNVFFVASMAGLGEGPAGYSGGIPGPPDIRGTGRSGVVLVFHGNEDLTADTFCHEAGHYLGLFHTSELYAADEPLHDPITDTAECVLRTPEDLEACEARTNIMFPLLDAGIDHISSGQSFVCRNNVMVK
jgi:hypothetical protein